MIPTSTTETVPFTPPWAMAEDGVTPKPGAIVFHLRSGSVIERGQMEAEIAGIYQAGRVFGFELRQAITSGVIALLADDPELENVLALLEREAEAVVGDGDEQQPMTDGERQTLIDVKNVLAQHWPEYRDLLARLERRREIAPIVALRRFCTGWENAKSDAGDDVVFTRGRDGLVTEAALGGLPQLDLSIAGNRAYALQYAKGQEGNSPRPSQSDDGQQTSRSDDTSKAAGKSPAKGGRKTPGSRSPRGSGQS